MGTETPLCFLFWRFPIREMELNNKFVMIIIERVEIIRKIKLTLTRKIDYELFDSVPMLWSRVFICRLDLVGM